MQRVCARVILLCAGVAGDGGSFFSKFYGGGK